MKTAIEDIFLNLKFNILENYLNFTIICHFDKKSENCKNRKICR